MPPTSCARACALLDDPSLSQVAFQQVITDAAQFDPPPKGAPDRGAAVDTWLDWREDEKRAGRWYRLEQIAKWSGYTIGDILVVWKLDRLGRSLRDLIATITTLHEKGVGFKSITESIDTTTPGGKLIFHVFGALAEFERDLIRERTHAGLTAARARGKVGGRPRVLSPKKVTQLQALAADRTNTIADILDTLNISRTTYYRYVKPAPATED